jgi:hypothetical protein
VLRQRETLDAELKEYVHSLRQPTLNLSYEDLLQDRNASLGQVFSFLGTAPLPVQGITLKNTRDNLREAVLNFNELRTRYVGTPYEPMFDEVLAST